MASNNLNRNSSNNGILAILDAAAMTSASNSPASNVQEGVPAQTSNHQSEGPAEPRTNSASNPVVKRLLISPPVSPRPRGSSTTSSASTSSSSSEAVVIAATVAVVSEDSQDSTSMSSVTNLHQNSSVVQVASNVVVDPALFQGQQASNVVVDAALSPPASPPINIHHHHTAASIHPSALFQGQQATVDHQQTASASNSTASSPLPSPGGGGVASPSVNITNTSSTLETSSAGPIPRQRRYLVHDQQSNPLIHNRPSHHQRTRRSGGHRPSRRTIVQLPTGSTSAQLLLQQQPTTPRTNVQIPTTPVPSSSSATATLSQRPTTANQQTPSLYATPHGHRCTSVADHLPQAKPLPRPPQIANPPIVRVTADPRSAIRAIEASNPEAKDKSQLGLTSVPPSASALGSVGITFLAKKYLVEESSISALTYGENLTSESLASSSNVSNYAGQMLRCIEVHTGREYACKVISSKPASSSSSNTNNGPSTINQNQQQPQQQNGSNLLLAHYRVDGHPAINRIREVVVGPERTYVVFPAAQTDLHTYVRTRRRLKEPQARHLFRQIVSAVHEAHSNGIVLRDLKLRKFVFNNESRLDITLESLEDAVVLEKDEDDTLSDKHGCPAYVSPEILKCNTRYSGRAADMWGLGVMLYTMLVGRYPFHGQEHTGLFAKIRRGHFKFPDSISSRAKCLIRCLLRKDPAERLSTADVLIHPWLTQLSSRERGLTSSSSASSSRNSSSANFNGDHSVPNRFSSASSSGIGNPARNPEFFNYDNDELMSEED